MLSGNTGNRALRRSKIRAERDDGTSYTKPSRSKKYGKLKKKKGPTQPLPEAVREREKAKRVAREASHNKGESLDPRG